VENSVSIYCSLAYAYEVPYSNCTVGGGRGTFHLNRAIVGDLFFCFSLHFSLFFSFLFSPPQNLFARFSFLFSFLYSSSGKKRKKKETDRLLLVHALPPLQQVEDDEAGHFLKRMIKLRLFLLLLSFFICDGNEDAEFSCVLACLPPPMDGQM